MSHIPNHQPADVLKSFVDAVQAIKAPVVNADRCEHRVALETIECGRLLQEEFVTCMRSLVGEEYCPDALDDIFSEATFEAKNAAEEGLRLPGHEYADERFGCVHYGVGGRR